MGKLGWLVEVASQVAGSPVEESLAVGWMAGDSLVAAGLLVGLLVWLEGWRLPVLGPRPAAGPLQAVGSRARRWAGPGPALPGWPGATWAAAGSARDWESSTRLMLL